MIYSVTLHILTPFTWIRWFHCGVSHAVMALAVLAIVGQTMWSAMAPAVLEWAGEYGSGAIPHRAIRTSIKMN